MCVNCDLCFLCIFGIIIVSLARGKALCQTQISPAIPAKLKVELKGVKEREMGLKRLEGKKIPIFIIHLIIHSSIDIFLKKKKLFFKKNEI